MKLKQKKYLFLIKAGLKIISFVGITKVIKTIYNLGKIKRLVRKL